MDSVIVGNALAVETRVIIDGEEALDVILFQPLDIKILFADDLLYPVRNRQHLIFGRIFAANNKEELSCGGTFDIEIVEEFKILFEQFSDSLMRFFIDPFKQIDAVLYRSV